MDNWQRRACCCWATDVVTSRYVTSAPAARDPSAHACYYRLRIFTIYRAFTLPRDVSVLFTRSQQ